MRVSYCCRIRRVTLTTRSLCASLQCVILTDTPLPLQLKINEYCRAHGIYFLTADVRGLFCWTFSDFGDSFEVLDKNGEDPPEVLVDSITKVNDDERRFLVRHVSCRHECVFTYVCRMLPAL